VVWFGVINAGAMLLSILGAEVVRRLGGTDNPVVIGRYLVGINVVLVAAVLGFALAGNFAVAVATYWAASLLRRTNDPSVPANRSTDNEPPMELRDAWPRLGAQMLPVRR